MRLHARPRPEAAAHVGDRMKLHRRLVRAAGRTYTVISPRPGTDVRFSTNYYHGTWHILTDHRGAHLLGRLLWGLSYARTPGTVVAIDRPFLDSDPFDGLPADPILLVPAPLTTMTDRVASVIRRALPRAENAGTVRWHTPGLADAVLEYERVRRPGEQWPVMVPLPGPERTDRLGGCVTYLASPARLRATAPAVYALATGAMSYLYLDDDVAGEVQVFANYRHRVSSTRTARREILDATAPADDPGDDEVSERIWDRSEQVRHRGRFRRLEPVPEPAR